MEPGASRLSYAWRIEALNHLKDAVRLYLDDAMEESLLPQAKAETLNAILKDAGLNPGGR